MIVKLWDINSQKSIQILTNFSNIVHQIEVVDNLLLIDQPGKVHIYELIIQYLLQSKGVI